MTSRMPSFAARAHSSAFVMCMNGVTNFTGQSSARRVAFSCARMKSSRQSG